jgi:virginiamycin B lyase
MLAARDRQDAGSKWITFPRRPGGKSLVRVPFKRVAHEKPAGNPMRLLMLAVAALLALMSGSAGALESTYYEVPKGDFPHDVAAGHSGEVWYAGQNAGIAGRLDPASGRIERIPLGKNSAPQGVIVGPDGAAWFTDGGQNAIVRVDPATKAVKAWPLPPERMPTVYLNTAAFDGSGRIWFTGQIGVYGRLDPKSGEMKVWDAPKGWGPYGITETPKGDIWFVSLAGSYLANVDTETGAVTVYELPTKDRGTRRVWSDSRGRLWISEWNSGNVSMFDPSAKAWREWKLPGDEPHAYAVWVDPDDKVWVSEWEANAVVRFDPVTETFDSFPSDRPKANVRQMLGRMGEVWIAESGRERIRVIRYGPKAK